MAISLNMLVNEVIAYKPIAIDEDRNPVYDEGVKLQRVYITGAQAQRNGSNGQESADTMELYYDVFNSLPRGYSFSKGDKIEFDGVNYFINSVKSYYNANGLQHFEIGLI